MRNIHHSSAQNRAIKDLDLPLPRHVVPMLRDDGIVTLKDWRALGEQRFKLFGITRHSVETIDRAAKEAQQ